MRASPELRHPEPDPLRLLIRAVGALVAFVLAAGVAVVLDRADDDGDDEPVIAGTGDDAALLPGTDVAGYIDARTRALASVEGEAVAVVSFSAYAAESAVAPMVDGSEVLGLLVAPPGGEPGVVEEELVQWASRQRSDAEAERRALQGMRDTTDDPDFRAEFQRDIQRLDRLVAALDPAGPIVFGALIRAAADDLRALAQAPGIRLVDVLGASVDDEDLRRARGLRPEEVARAGEPRSRPS